jgi:carboxypeptidase C (cathepsin A)
MSRPSLFRLVSVLCSFSFGATALIAQGGGRGGAGGSTTALAAPPGDVVTKHTFTAGGTTFAYTATTGTMPIRNAQSGDTEGNIFYVAYTRDGVTDRASRPVSFVFNGGPGSSTVWLHLGAFGPNIVKLNPDGSNPPPPYAFHPNAHTLLDQTDLVFLDPVGTGYSRAASPALGSRFFGLNEDMQSVAEFIRMYLVRNERFGSPKFLMGESYGTTRAAHLAGYLTDNGIALNGIAFLSTVLNQQNSRPHRGNDIAYVGFLPSFAMTAWYHKKVAPEYQRMSADEFASFAGQFASGEYAAALMKGAKLPAAERAAVVTKIARITGVAEKFVNESDLRIELIPFSNELLRDKQLATGRLDSRFTAFGATGRAYFDPSDASIRNSFTPVLNDYMRRVLNYEDDKPYYILGGGIGPWRYEEGAYANVVPSLERAFSKNPAMKIYVAQGYYDMATPYWAVQYTLDHMVVDPAVRSRNIMTRHFESGHMMYIDEAAMKQLRTDLRRFLQEALAPQRSDP